MGSPGVGARLGTRFGSYELRELIGMGGMGEVYRAYDTVRERMVALKLLRTDVAADPSYQDRFRRESRIAARLQEPHVIPVHDFGEIDGVLYIDMRLVEGASVKDELRVNGALPPARAVSIIGQVAAALDAAHANGLVHRDIKPENVLLTPDDFAYLVDFGIAYGGGEASVTKTGLVIGSCAYMATERLSGTAGGPASDVYSLTCLLYECLTGRAPFEAGDLRAGHERAHVQASAAAKPRAPGDQPRVRRRRREGHGEESRRPVHVGGRAGQGGGRRGARTRAPSQPSRPRVRRRARVSSRRRSRAHADGLRALSPSPTAGRARHAGRGSVGRRRRCWPGRSRCSRWPRCWLRVIVFTGGNGGSEPQSPLAAPPPSTTTITTTAASASEDTTYVHDETVDVNVTIG